VRGLKQECQPLLLLVVVRTALTTQLLVKQLLSQAAAWQLGSRIQMLPVILQQQRRLQLLTELLCKLSWQQHVLHLHSSATSGVHWKVSCKGSLQLRSRHSMMLLQLWQQQWLLLQVAAAAVVVLLWLVHCSQLLAGGAAAAALLLLGVLIMTVCRRRLLQQRLLRSRKLQHVLL
jgi:hypothetical protein